MSWRHCRLELLVESSEQTLLHAQPLLLKRGQADACPTASSMGWVSPPPCPWVGLKWLPRFGFAVRASPRSALANQSEIKNRKEVKKWHQRAPQQLVLVFCPKGSKGESASSWLAPSDDKGESEIKYTMSGMRMLTVTLLVRGANHMSGRRDPAGLDRAKTGSVLLVGRNELALPKWLRRDGHR